MNMKLGLVGCGMMGSRYAKVFGEMPGIEITACCDPTPAKLDRFRDRTGIDSGFTDYNEMLETVPLDAVLNVTYDPLHIPVLEAVLDRGLPILTEKPLGLTMDDCRRLDRFPAGVKKRVAVNFSKRNAGAVRGAAELVSAGAIGSLLSVEASYRQGWVMTNEWGNWREKNAWLWRLDAGYSPLGAFSDLGSHLLDLVLYITGEEFESIALTGSTCIDKGNAEIRGHSLDSPDRISTAGTLKSGVPVQVLASRIDIDQTDRPTVVIRGEKGVVSLDLSDRRHEVGLYLLEKTDLPASFNSSPDPRSGEWTYLPFTRPRNIYGDFAASLAGDPVLPPGLEDAMKVQAVLEAIRLSGDEDGRIVSIDEVTQ